MKDFFSMKITKSFQLLPSKKVYPFDYTRKGEIYIGYSTIRMIELSKTPKTIRIWDNPSDDLCKRGWYPTYVSKWEWDKLGLKKPKRFKLRNI